VTDAYRASFDMKRRNKLGLAPLEPFRRRIKDASSVEALINEIIHLHSIGMPELWSPMVEQDFKNSLRYTLFIWQGGLSLPDRDYYLLDTPEHKRVREAYLAHVPRTLRLAGYTPTEALRAQKIIIDIETRLAKASMSKEDLRQPEKIYNRTSLKELSRLAPALPWRAYFSAIRAGAPAHVIVGQPGFFKALSLLLGEVPLEEWKVYLDFQLINGAAASLSEKFVKNNFEFYTKVLTGQRKMRPLWRRALSSVCGLAGESLGKLYVAEHFPPRAKKEMDALVDDLFEAAEERMRSIAWMGTTTRKKAIHKLHAMKRKIGYPSKWRGYRGLIISPTDHFGNLVRASEFGHKREMKKLTKPIDRTEWLMYPQTVNAYFSPTMNEIVFPAAILQWPFFDLRADAAFNYGSIGSVIGHEITHGFDDEGSKFDAKGNLKSWWTKGDRAKFERKTQTFIAQAGAYEVEPGVHLNGKLTLGENMADAGGLIIGYYAYQRHLKKRGRRDIGGLSPEQRFFFGFAQMERQLALPEVKKLRALTDPHADAPWRINGPLSNFEPFYRTFGVKKGDKLYREPNERADVW
jgi:putative endopeptidase